MPDMNYSELLNHWAIDFAASESNHEIQGSPERTLERVVVSDTAGGRWILERIEEENLARKQQIASRLDALKASGLARIHPYLKNQQKTCFSRHQNQSWMVRPFVEGIPLDRDSYLTELWRAEAMAGFLIEMHPHARAITPPSTSAFSMPVYAEGRMEAWGSRYPGLA
jgi:homoserine kinase type II